MGGWVFLSSSQLCGTVVQYNLSSRGHCGAGEAHKPALSEEPENLGVSETHSQNSSLLTDAPCEIIHIVKQLILGVWYTCTFSMAFPVLHSRSSVICTGT